MSRWKFITYLYARAFKFAQSVLVKQKLSLCLGTKTKICLPQHLNAEHKAVPLHQSWNLHKLRNSNPGKQNAVKIIVPHLRFHTHNSVFFLFYMTGTHFILCEKLSLLRREQWQYTYPQKPFRRKSFYIELSGITQVKTLIVQASGTQMAVLVHLSDNKLALKILTTKTSFKCCCSEIHINKLSYCPEQSTTEVVGPISVQRNLTFPNQFSIHRGCLGSEFSISLKTTTNKKLLTAFQQFAMARPQCCWKPQQFLNKMNHFFK